MYKMLIISGTNPLSWMPTLKPANNEMEQQPRNHGDPADSFCS